MRTLQLFSSCKHMLIPCLELSNAVRNDLHSITHCTLLLAMSLYFAPAVLILVLRMFTLSSICTLPTLDCNCCKAISLWINKFYLISSYLYQVLEECFSVLQDLFQSYNTRIRNKLISCWKSNPRVLFAIINTMNKISNCPCYSCISSSSSSQNSSILLIRLWIYDEWQLPSLYPLMSLADFHIWQRQKVWNTFYESSFMTFVLLNLPARYYTHSFSETFSRHHWCPLYCI